MADATQTEQVTFEQGYEQLKSIVSELDKPGIAMHDMFEGFRRGKGLEKALREYLEQREGELAEIAEGKNVPEYEIVAPSESPVRQQVVIGEQDFGAASSVADEEIPF
jgi:exodeoxyribonuclease VII small subunit